MHCLLSMYDNFIFADEVDTVAMSNNVAQENGEGEGHIQGPEEVRTQKESKLMTVDKARKMEQKIQQVCTAKRVFTV